MADQEKRLDPRAVRTRAAIKDSFKELIDEREARSITVADITRRAGLSRKTFYLHYETIEALYEDMLRDLLEREANTYDETVLVGDMRSTNRAFFNRWAQAEPWEERLLCDPSYASVCDELMVRSYRRNVAASGEPYARYDLGTQELICDFLVSNSLRFYRRWVASGKSMPLERVIEVTGELMERGVSAFR